MDLYGSVFRHLLFPLWETGVRRRPTLDLLADLEARQHRSLDELQALQSAALRRLIRHAHANVPFERARLERAGLSPAELRDADDLARLPIVTADDLRAAAEPRGSRVPPLPVITKGTSGSTGKPFAFGYDRGSESWRQATKLRAYAWAGYRPGDPSFHFWGSLPGRRPPMQRAKIALDHRLRREHYVDCGRRGDDDLTRAAWAIQRRRPRVLLCYAQAGADLARHLVEHDLRPRHPLSVITGAEALLPTDRALLERAFGPAVFETYGCREVMLIAAECPAHEGLHVAFENLVVELVVREPDGERPARPGELGEVVVTDLHNYGMPFIRYANGDLAVAMPPGRCACGRSLPRLARVEGRITETLRDGQGRRVNGLVFNVVFAALAETVKQFRAVQHRDRSITLQVVPTVAFDANVRRRVLEACGRYLDGVPVRVETVDAIPTSATGKRPLVQVEGPASS